MIGCSCKRLEVCKPLTSTGKFRSTVGNQCNSGVSGHIHLFCFYIHSFSQSVSSVLSRVRLFETPQTAARQASLSITNSWNLLKLMSIELEMPYKHLILCISSSVIPFSSLLQSFPASGSFPMSQFFTSGGQSIGVSASASVLPKNTQD